MDASTLIGDFPKALNFNHLFLKLNQFICDEELVLPGHSVCKRSHKCKWHHFTRLSYHSSTASGRCSRLKPSYGFHLKHSRISAFQLKGHLIARRQSKNVGMKYKTHIELVHELHHGTYFQYNVKN